MLANASQAVLAQAAGSDGIPWWIIAAAAGVVVVVGAVLLLLAAKKGDDLPEMPCRNCGKVVMKGMEICVFCKTPRAQKIGSLEIVSGPLAGRAVRLDGDVTTIGSAPGSTIVLAGDGVSRKHAGIKKGMSSYELADLGSTNGIYVNGEKVAKKQLQLGDVIRIGTTEMVFKI